MPHASVLSLVMQWHRRGLPGSERPSFGSVRVAHCVGHERTHALGPLARSGRTPGCTAFRVEELRVGLAAATMRAKTAEADRDA